jgi:hypothetical protein
MIVSPIMLSGYSEKFKGNGMIHLHARELFSHVIGPFDKISSVLFISTYAAPLHVLSFTIVGSIHWLHDAVPTLRKTNRTTLWCHVSGHLADAATTATAKTRSQLVKD